MAIPLTTPLGPTLETPRLYLRPPTPEDFAGYCEFHQDQVTMKHLGGIVADPVTWRVMRTVAGAWALDGFHMFSVLSKATNEWIGRVGPLHPHGWPDQEIGWGLISRFCGKGLAHEAATACMDYAFDRLGWLHVVHTIAPDNLESQALAKRLGSAKIGPTQLPEPYRQQLVELWGQSRDQWQAHRKGSLQ